MANTVVQQVVQEMEELQKQLSQFKTSVEYLSNAKSNVSAAVDALNQSEGSFTQRIHELKETYHSFIRLSDIAGSLIQKLEGVNFPDRLDAIQSTINDTISQLHQIKEATIAEVHKAAVVIQEADFDGRFSRLQNRIDESVDSSRALVNGMLNMRLPEKIDELSTSVQGRLTQGYQELEKNTRHIAEDTSRAIFDLNLPVRIDKLDANIAGISSAIQNVLGRLDIVEANLKDKLSDISERQMNALSNFQDKVLNAMENERIINAKRNQTQLIINVVTIILVLSTFSILFFVKH